MVSIPNISQKTRYSLILGLFSCAAALVLWLVSPQISRSISGETNLVLKFYDVGQGDSLLIQKGATQILVDGGPDEDVLSHLGQDLLQWDREIELLVLTHPHADHLTGLLAVLEHYQVKTILYYPSLYSSRGYQHFLNLVANEGAEVLKASAGGQIQVGPLLLQILWPPANYHSQNLNNESVVMLFNYRDFGALLLGDAEHDAQKDITIKGNVNVIKVAHHGSSNGSYAQLLRTASPKLAIISAGEGNSFGHPHGPALKLLKNLGILTLRTDLNGTVTVGSDGTDFWYTTDR